jgi:thymidylate synthase (FAD)
MKVIEPYFEILDILDGDSIIKQIELIGRVCYKSEDKIALDSAKEFVATIIRRGHESVLEHCKISVRVICDRGISHEIVRHRIASYSQESTRYCNYSNNKFGNEITFIRPYYWDKSDEKYRVWLESMTFAEKMYIKLVELGAKPEEARSVLPNSLKTEIVVTMNLREWRHFFKLRTAIGAHPQMRQLTIPLLKQFKQKIPIIFDDILSDPILIS